MAKKDNSSSNNDTSSTSSSGNKPVLMIRPNTTSSWQTFNKSEKENNSKNDKRD